MKIDDRLMQQLMELACLDLPAAERAGLKAEVEEFLTSMEKLREVDAEGMEPMLTPSAEQSCLREDTPEAGLPVERLLGQAPERTGHYFAVPVKE